MAKKKKIFKQKIREMLAEAEKGNSPVAALPAGKQETPQEKPKAQAVAATPSITSTKVVFQDLKKIVLIFGIILVLIIVAVIISQKTDLLSVLADKLYNWAQLNN